MLLGFYANLLEKKYTFYYSHFLRSFVNTLLGVFWGKKLNVKELRRELKRSCEENIAVNQG